MTNAPLDLSTATIDQLISCARDLDDAAKRASADAEKCRGEIRARLRSAGFAVDGPVKAPPGLSDAELKASTGEAVRDYLLRQGRVSGGLDPELGCRVHRIPASALDTILGSARC